MAKFLSILAFHRVFPEKNGIFSGAMDAVQFDHLLRILKKCYLILPLSEAVSIIQKGTVSSEILSITFDDGYKDNFSVAMPILLKHKLRATFFVASGFLNGQWMWNDGIIEAVTQINKSVLDLSSFDLGYYDISSPAKKQFAINAILEAVKYQPNESRIKFANDLICLYGIAPPKRIMMKPEEVKSLYESGMEIGGHTISHPILAHLPYQDAYREIQGNKRKLENIINAPINVFAYPNGIPGKDFTQETKSIVKRLGYRAAVSTFSEVASTTSDPFELPRYTPWDKNPYKFMLRLWIKMLSVKTGL